MRELLRSLKHYLEVYRVQIKNNWVREAVYRSNFLTAIVTDLVWIGVEIGLFSVLYSNVSTLAGWTQHQVYFFLGIFFSSDALFTIAFQRNFFAFSDLVNKGELDILLTKPIHPVFLSLTRWINITAVFNFAMGLIIAAQFSESAEFQGGARWLLIIFWLALGLIINVLLRFAFAVWIFWTERNWALLRLYYHFFALATKPDTLYPKVIRYTILTALPFAFIGSVPARALLYGLETWEYIAAFAIVIIFFWIDKVLWRKGLQRYQSASS